MHLGTLALHGGFLASNKLREGVTVRSASRPWQERLRTSKEAHELFFRMLLARYRAMPGERRCKMPRADLEDLVNQSCFVCSILQDIRERAPVPDNILRGQIEDRFIQGDPTFLLELEGCLAEHSSEFQVHNLSVVRNILQNHLEQTGSTKGNVSLDFEATRLENSQRQLDMERIRNDVKRFEVWQLKCRNSQAARYYAGLEHRRKVRQLADEFSLRHGRTTFAGAVVDQGTALTLRLIRDLMADPTTTLVVPLLNWTVPSTNSAAIQNKQMEILEGLAADLPNQMVGLVFMPVFSYSKQGVMQAEISVLKTLSASSRLQAQHRWVLRFAERADQRDERPQVYGGRLVHPLGLKLGTSPFRTSALLFPGWTEPAVQKHAADMLTVDEWLGEDLRPEDGKHPIGAAQRFRQIGTDGWLKVMEAASTNICQHILWVDLSPDSGDTLEAFIQLLPPQAKQHLPLHVG